MNFTEDIRQAPDEEYVCWCSRVSKADVLYAKQLGARTLADVSKATHACTKGQCQKANPRGR